MVTARDRLMLDWLEQFRMATAEQINRVAYNNMPVTWKRLRKLAEDGLIYREKNTIGQGYLYSTNRIRTIKQFTHDNIRIEFYFKLAEHSTIDTILVEKVFGSIRPDALFIGDYEGDQYFFLLEVETNANRSSVNYDKYNNFFLKEWKEFFEVKPIVIYVTDKNIDSSKCRFTFKQLNTKLDNFIDIFM